MILNVYFVLVFTFMLLVYEVTRQWAREIVQEGSHLPCTCCPDPSQHHIGSPEHPQGSLLSTGSMIQTKKEMTLCSCTATSVPKALLYCQRCF